MLDFLPQLFNPNAGAKNAADPYGIDAALKQRQLADALRKTGDQVQEGEMVSGHYVAPSWAQQLNRAVGAIGSPFIGARADAAQAGATGRINAAKDSWASSMPEDVQGHPELQGPTDPTNPTELNAVQANPLTDARILKHTLAGINIPTNEKNAEIYQKGASAGLTREDNQKARKDVLEATLAQKREADAREAKRDAERAEETKRWHEAQEAQRRNELASRDEFRRLTAGQAAERAAERRTAAEEKADTKARTESPQRSKERQLAQVNMDKSYQRIEAMADAEALIPKATSSGIGHKADEIVNLWGGKLPGQDEAGKLKALEGRLMSLMPHYTGNTSNRDTELYAKHAANVGDPTVNASTKAASAAFIKRQWEADHDKNVRHAQQFNKDSGDKLPTIDIGPMPRYGSAKDRAAAAGGRTSGGAVTDINPSEWRLK